MSQCASETAELDLHIQDPELPLPFDKLKKSSWDYSPENKNWKVLFINPPHIQIKGLYARCVFEPLGLSSVAAAVERAGYDAQILDTIGEGFDQLSDHDDNREVVGLSFENIEKRIREIAPHVVGIGIPFTIRAESAFRIAKIVKKVNPQTKVMVGGIHVTGYPDQCLEQGAIDYIVMGEGEGPVLELLNSIKHGDTAALDEIRGIGFKKNGALHKNIRENPIEDLDRLAYPARHLLPYDRYFSAQRVFATGRYGKRFATVSTSRGCPYTCSFCIIHTLFGRKWRYRSPENVVDEIQMLKEKYQIPYIHFEDDNLTLLSDRIVKIAELMIERKLNIKWDTPNGVMAHTIDDENIIRTLKASGCQSLCFAPESGDQWVIKNVVKKNIDLQRIVNAVKICKKVGLRSEAFFVIGFPGETKKQIENTIEYARSLRNMGLARAHFHIATPFEGTDVYYEAKEKGYLVDAPEGCIKLECKRIQTPDFTVKDIDNYFIQGAKLNPTIPFDKFRLAAHVAMARPVTFVKAVFKHLTKRTGSLATANGPAN